MSAYEEFARIYDQLMDNVPYDEWCSWICRQLHQHGITDGLVLDLGCGTGEMTRRLSGAGYEMIGVDNSWEMLCAAQEKMRSDGQDILYLLQDMRSFELYGTVRAVVSVCDSLNYLLSEEELSEVFALVHNYLDPGGIFVFDMNTAHTYREDEGNRTFAENREDCSFIWENFWDEEEQINEIDLTLFVAEEDGRYSKYSETHVQKAFDPGTVLRLLQEAGFISCQVYEAYTENSPDGDCGRLCFAAKKGG